MLVRCFCYAIVNCPIANITLQNLKPTPHRALEPLPSLRPFPPTLFPSLKEAARLFWEKNNSPGQIFYGGGHRYVVGGKNGGSG